MQNCNQCDDSFTSHKTLKTHIRDNHLETVYLGESLTPINRNEKGFTCPECLNDYKTTRTFSTHAKSHGLYVSTTKKRKLESDASSVSSSSTEDSSGKVVAFDEAAQPTKKLPQLTHRDVILETTNSLAADEPTQEDKMMLAKLGRWVPLVYSHDDMKYGMLTSSATASVLLSKNKTAGTWSSPADDNRSSSKEVTEVDGSHFIRHIKTTSKASVKLAGTQHEEITDETVDLLNRDWLEYPQMRYCASQLLAGAILVEGPTAVIINTIEPYSRDTLLDAHHERRLVGVETSFPSKPSRYGLLKICQLSTPDGLKLTIGSRTCNFLVTSSLRLDIISINLGPSTMHFTPSKDTRLYLDVSSIDACKFKVSCSTLSRSQAMPSLYLLRQVRSKFSELSTYSMCRSVSTIASQLELQPLTIWTLSDQESNQQAISQEKIGSLLFREVATQVIRNGENAVLELKMLTKLIAKTKEDSVVDKILKKIQMLYRDQDHIEIIGNALLNSQLTDLAKGLGNKRGNDKKIEDISKALYD